MVRTSDNPTERIDSRSPEATGYPRVAATSATASLEGGIQTLTSSARAGQEMQRQISEITVRAGKELSLRSTAALQATIEADLGHLQALAAAKTPSQTFELQSKFARERLELAFGHARDFQAIASKFLIDINNSLRGMFDTSSLASE
ncbi:phasin family protein [Rhizobium sp. Nf11,1]|uniref:phasin family protein n=2 Tax=Rhizobium TaxID=379 RepID=UPI003D337F96